MKIIPVKNLNTFKCKGVPHKTLPSENLLIMIVFTTNALIIYIIFITKFSLYNVRNFTHVSSITI